MQHQHQPDALSPEKMQLFMAGLSGLAPEEVRKAKVLYLRNAISKYRALQENVRGFRTSMGCMWIIPIFWPILSSQRRMIDAQVNLARERIQNAIDVWRDDLQGERFELDGEETRF